MMRQSASTSDLASGDFTVSTETFESLPDPVQVPGNELEWASPFVLPGFLHAWWEVFAPQAEPLILSVREGRRLIGIAPLQREGSLLRLIGGADVCDHLDVVVDPTAEKGILRNPPGLCEPRGRDPDRPRAGPVRFGRHDGACAARPRERVAGCERNRRRPVRDRSGRPPGRNTWIGCPASSATRSDASSGGWSKVSRSRFEWWAAAGRSPPAWKIF